MLDIYRLGGGLDWISNVWCAMITVYHVWELMLQVWQSPGIRRRGGGGKHGLSHSHVVLGSVLAVLLCPICLQPHHWFKTLCPWHWSYPTSCVLLAYWAGAGRAGANLWVQCKSGMVFSLKSALFPLHLHLCNWDPDLVQGDRSILCSFLWFFVAEVLLLRKRVRFHWHLNQHGCFSKQKFALWAEANTIFKSNISESFWVFLFTRDFSKIIRNPQSPLQEALI